MFLRAISPAASSLRIHRPRTAAAVFQRSQRLAPAVFQNFQRRLADMGEDKLSRIPQSRTRTFRPGLGDREATLSERIRGSLSHSFGLVEVPAKPVEDSPCRRAGWLRNSCSLRPAERTRERE